ncbi:MAG: extracellular solute-binding protein [Clostridia bacterium]
MRKFGLKIGLIIVIAVLIGVIAGCVPHTDETLYVLNWGDYIDESLKQEFVTYYKERTGKSIRLQYSELDTNEQMLTQVIENDSAAGSGTMQLDMLAPSEYAIQKLLEKGLLQKIGTEDELDKFWGNIEPMVKEHVDETFSELTIKGEKIDMTDYLVPYMWGTLGILYNKDVVKPEDLAQGWGLLWNKNNNPELVGKIYMKDSIRDAYVAGVMYLKENNRLPEAYKDYKVEKLINTVTQELLEAVEVVLTEQKTQKILYSVDFDKEEVIAGNAYVDLAWSGDAVYSIEEAKTKHNRNLGYLVPESGSNIWFDGWVIPKKAQNPAAAKIFIEFLNLPLSAMKNMWEIGYTTGVKRDLMRADEKVVSFIKELELEPDDIFLDPVQYFDGNCEMGVMKDFGDNEAKVVSMWERTKVNGITPITKDNTWVFILIAIGGVAVIGAIIAFIMIKKKGGKRRKIS